MSIPANAFLPVKRQKLIDIAPGSIVKVTSLKGVIDPFTGVVAELRKAYGPSRQPALAVAPEQDEENMVIVPDNGQWEVTVIRDAAILAASATPPHLVIARKKPVAVEAVKFTGGVQSALEIIRWAGGKAVVKWNQPVPGQVTESLSIPMLEGKMEAFVGDWVIKGVADEFYPCKASIFTASYDIISEVEQPVSHADQVAAAEQALARLFPQ